MKLSQVTDRLKGRESGEANAGHLLIGAGIGIGILAVSAGIGAIQRYFDPRGTRVISKRKLRKIRQG